MADMIASQRNDFSELELIVLEDRQSGCLSAQIDHGATILALLVGSQSRDAGIGNKFAVEDRKTGTFDCVLHLGALRITNAVA